MSAPASPSVAELARQENVSPEQIMANALALYAALPPAVRASTLDALQSADPAAHGELIQDLVRTAVVHEIRRRREERRRQVLAGERPGRPTMSDEELGAEAVRLVKASRERRAQLRRAQGG